jgi:hypothetical protein
MVRRHTDSHHQRNSRGWWGALEAAAYSGSQIQFPSRYDELNEGISGFLDRIVEYTDSMETIDTPVYNRIFKFTVLRIACH